MESYPLGNLSPTALIEPAILATGHLFYQSLPDAPDGDLSRVYNHWSGAKCALTFPDYNVSLPSENGHYRMEITHDLRDNCRSTYNKTGYAEHTYHRNYGAIGVCLDAMAGVSSCHDQFEIPVMGLHYLALANALLCKKYKIDPQGVCLDSDFPASAYYGEPTIYTHAEAANQPGAPPQYENYFVTGERWDFATFVTLPAGVECSVDFATTCGNAIRSLTLSYYTVV
jgi:hypothetical protein